MTVVTLEHAASPSVDHQKTAADPRLSAFVTANAGSGKTTTLVSRVARLLLAGARPEAIAGGSSADGHTPIRDVLILARGGGQHRVR
jgi:hypothetical protein